MYLTIRRLAILGILTAGLAGTTAFGQEGGGEIEKAAQVTRGELSRLLQQYPPRLAEVLKLDPSLLGNENYMAPYPEIRTFLNRHPEIARNPDYFFGSISSELENLKQIAREAELSQRFDGRKDSGTEVIFDVLAPIVIFFAIVGPIAWVIRRFQEHRQWLRVWRTQSEAHSKVMDRLTSNDDLLAYLNTPAGKKFFEASNMPPVETPMPRASVPVGRIMWSVQAGLVLLLGGISLRFVYGDPRLNNEDLVALNILSVVGIGLGVSFILSAAASFMISARLGLIDPPAPPRRPPSVVEPPSST